MYVDDMTPAEAAAMAKEVAAQLRNSQLSRSEREQLRWDLHDLQGVR